MIKQILKEQKKPKPNTVHCKMNKEEFFLNTKEKDKILLLPNNIQILLNLDYNHKN